MRHELRHYVDVSMNSGSPKYKMLGDGIESLTEEMNPEEETKQYINTESASSSVKSYQRTIEVDKEDCADDDVQEFIDKLVDRPPVGSAAQTSFVRFRLKDKAGEAGKYKAIKVPCTVSPSSTGGDGGDYVHNVINLKQCGDDIPGVFDIKTETFTPDADE